MIVNISLSKIINKILLKWLLLCGNTTGVFCLLKSVITKIVTNFNLFLQALFANDINKGIALLNRINFR